MGTSDGQLHVVEIVALLRELTARLITGDDLDEALRVLVRTTTRAVPGPAWCGITLIREGAPVTAAVSAPLPPGVDEIEPQREDGPCLTAVRSRDLVVGQDLAVDARWPSWRSRVLGSGIHGVLSVPLDIDEQVIGALTLYAAEPYTFSSDVQLAVLLVAEHAGLLLAAVLDRTRTAGHAAELAEAQSSGETVNRAVGIVMAQRGCSAEDALGVLRQASVRLRVPLEEVADRLVSTIASRSA
jgi:GAF domain-containing protein